MSYERKTVDRPQYNLVLILLFIMTTITGFLYLDALADRVEAKEMLSPLADAMIVEKQVEKPVAVYTHPKTIEDKIKALWPNDWETAIKVFTCESGLNPTAYNENTNGSIDVGIAQVNSIHGVSAKMLTDVDVNLAVARQIYDNAGGWTPWVCYTRGNL